MVHRPFRRSAPFDFARGIPAPGRYPPDRLGQRQAAEAIRHAPVEIGYGFDARGRQMFRQVGDENRIMRFRTEDLTRLKDGTFVHNHPPYRDYPENDPRRRAGSFSATDLVFAYEVDLVLMVAVTEERTYSVARPPGDFFLDPRQIEEEYRDLIVRVQERRIGEQVAGRMTLAEASSSGLLADEVMDSLGPFYVYWWEEVG
jgi:hypothetical protein